MRIYKNDQLSYKKWLPRKKKDTSSISYNENLIKKENQTKTKIYLFSSCLKRLLV